MGGGTSAVRGSKPLVAQLDSLTARELLLNIAPKMRLFQHCGTGEVLVLIAQDIHQAPKNVVDDPDEWYEIITSSLQASYFENLQGVAMDRNASPPLASPHVDPFESFRQSDAYNSSLATSAALSSAARDGGRALPSSAALVQPEKKLFYPPPATAQGARMLSAADIAGLTDPNGELQVRALATPSLVIVHALFFASPSPLPSLPTALGSAIAIPPPSLRPSSRFSRDFCATILVPS